MPDLLYIDIETRSNPDMLQFLPTFTHPTVDDAPPSAKASASKLQRWLDQEMERRKKKVGGAVEKMPLDVDYCRIVALGYARDDDEILTATCVDPESEEGVLRLFWTALANSSRPCGYNILGFDLPIILRRSWVLGVVPTKLLDLRRYSTAYTVDLMQVLYNWGAAPGPTRGLKAVAAMYGIENAYPELDGGKVALMSEEELRVYCANDVRMTRELAQRMKGWYWR